MSYEIIRIIIAWITATGIILLSIIYPMRIYIQKHKLCSEHPVSIANKFLRKIHKPLGVVIIPSTFLHCRLSYMWIVLGLIALLYDFRRRKSRNQVSGKEEEIEMKILILYDSRATNDNGVNWLSLILDNLDSDYNVQTVLLDYREINPCTGCFSCWTKTPGTCVITNDNANHISSSYINADKVILLSHITYGGYSADTKAFLDRSIINISPFFTIKNDEMHHQKRYSKYPDLIAVGYGDMTDNEQSTFMELSERNALNLHPPKHIAFTVRNRNEMVQVIQDLRIFLEKEVIQK